MEKRKLEINEENVRLDKFIMNSISDLSRTLIQEYIKEGYVLVNGKIEKASYKIKMNDAIEITIPDNKEMDVLPEDIPLDIVYEDQDVIVVNKPSGMIVHPSAGIYSGTLVNALLYHCKDLSGINGVNRPGIVHRIDKETSGLLMVAKNDKAHKSLSEQLKEHSVTRRYVALVHGVIPHVHGKVNAPIGRDVNDRQKMAVTKNNSKEAMEDGMHVYENKVGVLTNNPPFNIQMFLLNQYMGLSPKQPENLFAKDIELNAYSRGMGAIGLPGDLSSSSRFAKVAFTKLHSVSGNSESESVSQFFHILGSVDQQRGCCDVNGKYEITLYTSCCNAQKGIYYYTTYDNHQISAVDMTKEDLDSTELIKYEVIQGEHIFMQN